MAEALLAGHARAAGAAEELPGGLDAVAGDLAAAVGARRRHAVDRALEAVEHVALAGRHYLEGLVVLVAAHLALRHGGLLPALPALRWSGSASIPRACRGAAGRSAPASPRVGWAAPWEPRARPSCCTWRRRAGRRARSKRTSRRSSS